MQEKERKGDARGNELTPIDELKIITLSTIFGEPQYYRHTEDYQTLIIGDVIEKGKTASEIIESIIDKALDYDFGAVIKWAVELRQTYLVRITPQIIMVRAALSDKKKEYTMQNQDGFAKAQEDVLQRADDVSAQFNYFMYYEARLHGNKPINDKYLKDKSNKQKCPASLKRSWARKLESLTKYELYKYQSTGFIDIVRVCHAHSDNITELMQTSSITLEENKTTWSHLKAEGKSWKEIIELLGSIPHMALLRNIRGIFTEIDDVDVTNELMTALVQGVRRGKQYPYRYITAKNAVEKSNEVHNKDIILEKLDECISVACYNLPTLPGKSVFLADNTESTKRFIGTNYGSITMLELNNLSATIGAFNSDEGTVIKFGERLKTYEITRRYSVDSQIKNIINDKTYGDNTEGLARFFETAIKDNIFYDNLFLYTYRTIDELGLVTLIEEYRSKVNAKLNVYIIKTEPIKSSNLPNIQYRTTVINGWTGNETIYANVVNTIWDRVDKR